MINKLKKIFLFDDEFDASRRRFIKTAGALAALTVVVGTVPSLLKIKSIEKQIASGIIEGEIFYIDRTVIIDIPNVIIRNCEFIATAPMDYMLDFGPNTTKTIMTNCHLNGKDFADCCIRIQPQASPVIINNYFTNDGIEGFKKKTNSVKNRLG